MLFQAGQVAQQPRDGDRSQGKNRRVHNRVWQRHLAWTACMACIVDVCWLGGLASLVGPLGFIPKRQTLVLIPPRT